MKKMMIFLMMSVFFLMGGMTDSMAQKVEKNVEKSRSFPNSLIVNIGETVRMTFYLRDLYLYDLSDVIAIHVFVQHPGENVKWILTFNMQGRIIYRNNKISDRITAYYSVEMQTVTVTISSAMPQDTGAYYILLEKASGLFVFSDAFNLTVVNMSPA